MSCLVSIVGARPQFVKLAPVARELANRTGVTHKILHTGQHYDTSMSQSFFDLLQIPKPDLDLGVGSGTHAAQTAEMLTRLEAYLAAEAPDIVIVYGDTNSTLAATLAASKIHLRVAHVEAGLRSFNRSMPEEINRLVADHCSDRLYAPTRQAMENLDNENLRSRAVLVGDVMLDAVDFNREIAGSRSRILDDSGLLESRFGLVTIHRPVNTTPQALRVIMMALRDIAADTLPLYFPMHPRTRKVFETLDFDLRGQLKIVEPVTYLDMIALTEAATVVVTDSGGLQKEAAILGTQCITLRDETEWVETVQFGVNRLVTDHGVPLKEAVADCVNNDDPFPSKLQARIREYYGSGEAARRIGDDLLNWTDRR